MRFATDMGGTFTDLVVEDDDGTLTLHKSHTVLDDPVQGVLDVLGVAADAAGLPLDELLGRGELLIHGTTRALNAILTGRTARTAFLSTAGHPDILLFREGGRTSPFDFTRAYPEPYVPRALTFEVPERVDPHGAVVTALDEQAVIEIAARLHAAEVEAVAVCLLWSIVNPDHERRIGELLDEHLPGVPYTLSHRLNPTLREYRRASSTAIDASLKPVMTDYITTLTERLGAAGFRGRTLVLTSNGGVMDAAAAAAAPIHVVNSGPAMAPVAGRDYARVETSFETAIVADTGGTSYDVSLVRRGRIPRTRETWIGAPYFGHMTGLPSVDVKSVGAGGGSIAWTDDGGLLHVGPQSAGSRPGPACYGRGGSEPTVTDAALVLGHIDPDYFLGGAMPLDRERATEAIRRGVGEPLGLDLPDAAAAVMTLATEHMVQAIEDITVNQGIDPREAVLVGGGGAAGLNVLAIARRLGSPKVLIPSVGSVLSAAGALLSDLSDEYAIALRTTSVRFDFDAVAATLAELGERCREFETGPGAAALETTVEYLAEMRYPDQVWDLEVALPRAEIRTAEDVEELRQAFHAAHEEVFAISDPESHVEIVGWRARVRCRLRDTELAGVAERASDAGEPLPPRDIHLPGYGAAQATILRLEDMPAGVALPGPAIVESPFTTVVVDAHATVSRTAGSSLVIDPLLGAKAPQTLEGSFDRAS